MRNTNKVVIKNLMNILDTGSPNRISKNALAGLAGIHYSTLTRKLSGQTPFTVDEIDKISEALHLSTLDLISDSEASDE